LARLINKIDKKGLIKALFLLEIWGEAQGAGRRVQGDLRHLASPSLGHYAALSFVVRGKGQESGVKDQGKSVKSFKSRLKAAHTE
jgi:hypothetical protein